jgi:hypothetical protein
MFIKGKAFSTLCFALAAGATTQTFLGLGTPSYGTSRKPLSFAAPYDEGLFMPVEELSALSEAQFTTLGHPVFPNYSVRIKKSSDFCDGTVK